jgi:hypothetical protein
LQFVRFLLHLGLHHDVQKVFGNQHKQE